MTYLLRSATVLSVSALLISGCTIQTTGSDPETPPAAQPGAQTTPAPQATAPTGGPRTSSGAHNRRILRPIGSPAPQPGAQPSQPAPAPAGRAPAQALPASGGGDDTNAQACVDALESAAAKSCDDARAHAQKCGTDQKAEIIAAVDKACPGG